MKKSGYGYGIPDLEESPVANEYISDKERPEISRLRSDISSADARKKQADSDSHPKIDLFAKYQLNGRMTHTWHPSRISLLIILSLGSS